MGEGESLDLLRLLLQWQGRKGYKTVCGCGKVHTTDTLSMSHDYEITTYPPGENGALSFSVRRKSRGASVGHVLSLVLLAVGSCCGY